MGLSDLPLANGRRHVKVFISLGWSFRSRHKNHFVLTHPDHPDVFAATHHARNATWIALADALIYE
jgi:hypothetical protein